MNLIARIGSRISIWGRNHAGAIVAGTVTTLAGAAVLGVAGLLVELTMGWIPFLHFGDDSKLELVDASFSEESIKATTLVHRL